MQWSNRKGNLGHVRAMINQHTRESNIKHLAISSFHAMTYMIFKNTLAHEMIHIKQLSTHTFDPSSPHGYSFINEANRINRMGLGYNITKSSEEMLDISDKTRAKGKELIAILFNINGRYTVTVTTPRVFETDIDYVIRIFDRSINAGKYRKIEILAVESSNPELLKYTIQRTYKNRISHAPISDELRDDLLGSKVVKLVILERDKPRYMSETDNADDAGNWEEIIIV
jgi:N6-adenosine-specific RNA methylase IME4